MSDVLFEIKEENLETGMRGYPVGYCVTSTADPQKGLSYAGIPIIELVERDPLSVIYLLYYGEEPTKAKLTTFQKEIAGRSILSPTAIDAIYSLPRKGHPMKLLSAALLIEGMIEGTGNYREDCLNLIAKAPILVAHLICHHAGWKTKPSSPSLGYMENFAEMLNVPNGDLTALTRTFRIFNVLHYDHGGGNLSAFIGKGVASGLEDLYGSISAAMCALSGPRHGKANQDCLQFVEGLYEELGNQATEELVEKSIRQRLEENKLVFGFGHAVLRVEDPRATYLYAMAEKYHSNHPLVKIALHLRKSGTKVLKENPKISNPYPNVDAISGTVLTAAGFSYPDYFTVLFGLARIVGISIQIVYERCEARDGKGTPIIRPKYFYKQR